MKPCIRFLAALSVAIGTNAQAADAWPSRTITVVAPGPAGGTSDIFARLIADGLAKELGATVIVENRDGAGTLIGSKAVASAKPDGHTLLVGAAAIAISPQVYKTIDLDPRRDLQPVRILARFPNVVVVKGDAPVKNVAHLLDTVRAKPGAYNYSSGSVGISEHLSGELFKSMTGADILHVPFKGSANAALAVVTGDALVSFGNMAVVMPQVKAGKLRAIAVTSASRSTSLPDVPTVAESGVPGYEVSTWFGLLAPAGTPEPIVRRLDEATRKFLALPQTREKLLSMGAEPVDEGPAAFAAVLRRDWDKWGEVVRKANIRAE
jgi:tripartite-type tricarboxylate transporter receptor subunit TctC